MKKFIVPSILYYVTQTADDLEMGVAEGSNKKINVYLKQK